MAVPRLWGVKSDIDLSDLPLRDDLRGRTPYGAPQAVTATPLNVNENSYPVPPQVVAAMRERVDAVLPGLNRYPDREFTELREALADYLGHGLDAGNLWAANGSNEVLQQLLMAFGGPGRTALGFTPAYSMHPIIAECTGTRWIDGHRNPDFSLDTASAVAQVRAERPDVVFVVSPNNPTGTAVPLELIEAVYDVAPGIVIVDEAYTEFSRHPEVTALDMLPGRGRLVVSRTMSKAFALAGARLGYFAADPAVCDAIRLVRLPYHLSAVTQAVALAALDHRAELLSTVATLRDQRDRIVEAVTEMGLIAVPSDANFVMIGEFDDPQKVWQGVLDHGILIRNNGIPRYLRVTAGTPEETTAFLRALADVLGLPVPSQATGPAPAETAGTGVAR